MASIPAVTGEIVTAAEFNELVRGHWRKTTSKTVNTTVAATDLLNAEVTIGAGAMSTNRGLRLTAWGDVLQNSGGASAPPRFQLVLGGTTLLDTGTTATGMGVSATRTSWRMVAEIFNTGAAATQLSSLLLDIVAANGFTVNNTFTTGSGTYVATPSTGGLAKAIGTNNTTVDTATSKTLVLNTINGSASATYETKLFGALVELL